MRKLAGGRYMDSGDNVLLLGPPGVGKTHLAVALGIKACEQGVRTLFITATALITTLGRALAEGRRAGGTPEGSDPAAVAYCR